MAIQVSQYHDIVKAGQMFTGIKATAAAIPKYDATSLTQIVLWNPLGSGVNAFPVRYTMGWAATTETPGNIVMCVLTATGSGVATGLPFAATTAITQLNANTAVSTTGKCSCLSAATLTAAGTRMLSAGFSHLTTTGTATFGSFQRIYDFKDMVCVGPGTAIYFAGYAATASTYTESLIWYEE